MIVKDILHSKDILMAVAGIYNTMHLFDLEKGSCAELFAFKEVHDLFENNGNKLSIQELIHVIIKNTTTKEYLPSLLEFTDFSTLNQRLKGKQIISFDFVGNIHGWTRCSFIPVNYDADGNLIQFLYTTRIIQEDKAREEELLNIVDYDELTGVYNRRAYEKECERIEKEGMSEFFTIITFDINLLKATNDEKGYLAGNELIKGAGECLQTVFGEKGKIFRIGGGDFIVFIDCPMNELFAYFSNIDTKTAAWKGNLVTNLTISKGCSAHPEFPDLSIRELQVRADRRMFQEKEAYYQTRDKTVTNSANDPALFKLIMQKSYMGLISLEFEDYYPPRLQIDDNIKGVLGLSENLTPEQLYEEWINRIHPDYSDSISSAIEKVIIGNQTEVQYPWFHPKAGVTYLRNFSYRDPNYTKGVRVNGFIQNITNLVHLQKDSLTGFYTKEIFYQKADEILKSNPDKNYRFFVSDIENFKSVNEKYGVEMGDKLLSYLALSLKRKTPNLILAGRISADKFVILQGENSKQTREEGLDFQRSILKDSPVQNIIWKHGIYYSKYERDISAQKMCDRAIYALETIKGNYEVSCAVYDETLAKQLKIQHQILENMEDALKNKEFKVYLQPKHDLHSNKTGGAEALVRWIHPEIGYMNPGDFIPLFEQNGFVKNVDQFVFDEVCTLIKRWLKEGKRVVPISVNLSRRDFEYEDLANMIIEAIDRHNIPHNLIHFEITESAFSDNPERITKTIRRLHDTGFVIELDDFGSGYSSLTSLTEIEFDILKLDMSIIKKDNPNSTRNVLNMCSQIVKQMNLLSVAEGVENETQLQRLKDIGCDYIQGYYFSKPLPIEDFEKYLANEK